METQYLESGKQFCLLCGNFIPKHPYLFISFLLLIALTLTFFLRWVLNFLNERDGENVW